MKDSDYIETQITADCFQLKELSLFGVHLVRTSWIVVFLMRL